MLVGVVTGSMVIVGAVVSKTIVVVAVPMFPAASVAVAVILFEPSTKLATTDQVVAVGVVTAPKVVPVVVDDKVTVTPLSIVPVMV